MTGKNFEDPINLRVILEKMTADIDAVESTISRMAKETLARAGEVEALRNELHSVKVRSQILLDAKNDIIVALRANLEDAEKAKEALRLQLSEMARAERAEAGLDTARQERERLAGLLSLAERKAVEDSDKIDDARQEAEALRAQVAELDRQIGKEREYRDQRIKEEMVRARNEGLEEAALAAERADAKTPGMRVGLHILAGRIRAMKEPEP